MKIEFKTGLYMIVIAISAFIYLTVHFASSEEVQTLSKDVRYIELFNLNQVIMIYQTKYECYLPPDCLPRMNEEDKVIYLKLQDDKAKLLERINK